MVSDPNFDLSGRVALVTGAARGLGAAIARGLADAGATLVVNGRDRDALEATRVACSHTTAAEASVFDVADRDAVTRAVAALDAQYGGVDILVNSAGINRRAPFMEFKPGDWDAVIATNLTGTFNVAQAVAPRMSARGHGSIVNIASLMTHHARPNVVAYTASKGGVGQLTQAMAVELATKHIRVNAIAPGYFATEMNRALLDDAAFVAWVEMRTPMKRWGQPRELAGLAVFLASDAASYVTGQVIHADGGMSVNL